MGKDRGERNANGETSPLKGKGGKGAETDDEKKTWAGGGAWGKGGYWVKLETNSAARSEKNLILNETGLTKEYEGACPCGKRGKG